jgi:D-glycero-alpha-D-manno-heptose 1-phosphate guanylyltransferase
LIQTAIILAGGFGTRLKTIVSDVPKPMAPVNREPFLNFQLRYLKHYGIKKVIVSTGHLAEKIESFYGEHFEGLKMIYSRETTPLGTGGGIRLAMKHCDSKESFVLNGDSFFDVNLFTFYEVHKKQGADVSLALRKVDNASRYGSIEVSSNNRIISFLEKSNWVAPGLINGGTYILNKEIYLNNTKDQVNFSIEKDFFAEQTLKSKMIGFQSDGYFIDIGIPEDYQKAQDDLKGFKYR